VLHHAGVYGRPERAFAMKDKLRQIERLCQLRETRERMSEALVAIASARLRETEQLLTELKAVELGMARASIRSIEAGERPEWTMSQTLREAFMLDGSRLQEECMRREEEKLAAQKELKSRRIETEQAVSLRRDAKAALQIEEEHRTQTESLDSFLARRQWRSGRIRVRALIEGD